MNPTAPSHYEVLKVARDAPPEVIRAAYRSLAQKYHPDRNVDANEAARIMSAINAAYEVLSDPEKRRAYDRSMAEAARGVRRPATGGGAAAVRRAAMDGEFVQDGARGIKLAVIGIAAVVVTFVLWGTGSKSLPPAPVATKAPRAVAPPAPAATAATDEAPVPPANPVPPASGSSAAPPKTGYVRSPYAPNGRAWPLFTGYVSGYARLNDDGNFAVTVDNVKGESDVFVRLVALAGSKGFPVRSFFIQAHGHFTLENLSAGNYDVRVMDLETGRLLRTEGFALEEGPAEEAGRLRRLTIIALPRALAVGPGFFELADADF